MRLTSTNERIDLEDVAAKIVSVFPTLNPFEQRLSLEIYRVLSEGEPVSRSLLADRLQVQVEAVDRALKAWPGVYLDSEQRIVGYWGLSIASAYQGPHRLMVDGRRLSAWCAWDTLFLPELLGKRAEVESNSPDADQVVKLIVAPAGVEYVEPADVQMSFVLPDQTQMRKDVLSTFCHFVHFFPSRQAGEAWTANHQGTFILAVPEAHAIAHRKNRALYGEAL